jgi:hypothetical protein
MSVKDDDLDDQDLTGLYCPAVGFLASMLALMRVIEDYAKPRCL